MAKAATRGRKPAQNETAKAILAALNIMAPAKPDPALPQSEYVLVNEGWIVGYNGTLAIGVRADAGFNGVPHRGLLKEALSNVGKALTITVMSESEVSIKAGDNHFIVPMASPGSVIPTPPDANVYAIDNRVRAALVAASKVTKDTAETVLEASVLFNGETVLGTDRMLLIESWHGYQLPTNIPVPKSFVQAIDKVEADVIGFGMGADTITMHFADGTFVRTQFYKEGWPGVPLNDLFATDRSPVDIPKGLFEAVKQVAPFSVSNIVLFRNEHVQTHEDGELGAKVAVKGLFDEGAFNHKHLTQIADMAEKMIVTSPTKLIAFGGVSRLVMTGFDAGNFPDEIKAPAPTSAAVEQASAASPAWGNVDPAKVGGMPAWGQGRAEAELAAMAQGEADQGPFAPTVAGGTQTEPVNAGTPQPTAPVDTPESTGDAWSTGQSAQPIASPSSDWGVANVPLDSAPGGGTATETAPSAGPAGGTSAGATNEDTPWGQTVPPSNDGWANAAAKGEPMFDPNDVDPNIFPEGSFPNNPAPWGNNQ